MKFNEFESTDTSKAAATIVTGVLGAAGIIVLMGLAILWSGFFQALAGWQLYQWFIFKQFEWAPDLNGWHIAGILTLTHLGLRNSNTDSTKSTGEKVIYAIIMDPLYSAMIVFMGWLIAKMAGLI